MRKYALKGKFILEVVDEQTGKIEYKSPEKNNLILNQGIGYVAARSFVENMLFCAVATSTTPPLLTDTGLIGEVARTGNADFTVPEPYKTTLTGNIYALTKVFRFNTQEAPMTIGTIMWSPFGVAGNNGFSKSLVITENGNLGPVTIGVGKYLRVYYTLEIIINPATPQIGDANIVGWTTPSQYAIQLVGLRKFNANGTLGFWDAGEACNEPSGQSTIFIGENSAALSSFGSSVNRSGSTNYTVLASNNYLGGGVMQKKGSFGKSSAINSSLRSMGYGASGSPASNSGFVVVFDSNQSKGSGVIMELIFTISWGT